MKAAAVLCVLVSCRDNRTVAVDAAGSDAAAEPDVAPAKRTVFVVTMENKPPNAIYGNDFYAPYINELMMGSAAYSTNFGDVLPALPSEPHYICHG